MQASFSPLPVLHYFTLHYFIHYFIHYYTYKYFTSVCVRRDRKGIKQRDAECTERGETEEQEEGETRSGACGCPSIPVSLPIRAQLMSSLSPVAGLKARARECSRAWLSQNLQPHHHPTPLKWARCLAGNWCYRRRI